MQMTVEEPVRVRPLALVVDDEEATRILAAQSLQEAGFAVEEAENGAQALCCFDRVRPDFVLLDIMMPEMDGFAACAAMRQRQEGRTVPIVMMTCLEDVASIHRAYAAGATDFISKPIKWGVLRHRIPYLMHATAVAHSAADYRNRYRDLFDRVPVGLFRVLFDGSIIDANRALLEIGRFPDKESLLARNIRDFFVDPEDISRMFGILRTQGIVQGFETRLVRSDGALRWAEVSAQIVSDAEGKIVYYDGSVQDVTARKETEQAEREQMRMGQLLLDSLPCVALLLRPRERQIVASNKAAVEVGAVPGTTCFSTWGARNDPCPWCLAPTVWTAREACHRVVETPERTWDAHWIPVADNLFMHFAFDITETTRAEKELSEKEEQLRQAQKMEAVGRLAGGIAHDFNNFLTAINGYSDLLLARLNEADPLRPEVEEIRKAGTRAASLTRQLLAFSRKQVLQPKVLDLNAVIADVGSLLKRLIGEDIELTTVLADELGRVKADPGHIEQILLNLAINSRDAMPAGGKLTLETANLDIAKDYLREHASVRAGRYVVLAVSDTGHGMDAATKARLFEPFFTTKAVGKGTGLGLATVYGMVKQSGGYVWCYSEPARGTCFKVYLPRVEEEADASDRRPGSWTGRTHGTETILVVEDEEPVRQLVANVLETRGYTVLRASDGEQAMMLSGYHTGPIHLVLSDIVMPGMTGPEMVERIATGRPDVKALFMSGYTDKTVAHHGFLAEDAAYIEKPFGLDKLTTKVREVLDG